MLWLIVVAATVGIFVVMSLRVIRGNEMAISYLFGEQYKFHNSGLTFLPWIPFTATEMIIAPKKLFDGLEMPIVRPLSKKGDSEGDDVPIWCDAVRVAIHSSVYVRFPQSKKLFDIYENGVPIKRNVEECHQALQGWMDDTVKNLVFQLGKTRTWRGLYYQMEEFRKEVDERLHDTDGLLLKVGFSIEDFWLLVTDINIPTDLEAKLADLEKARIDRERSAIQAEATAHDVLGDFAHVLAQSQGISVPEAQKLVHDTPELQEKAWRAYQDFRQRKLTNVLDIRTGNTDGSATTTTTNGLKNLFLEIIAAWQRMPSGGASRAGDTGTPKETKDDPTLATRLEQGRKYAKQKGW